MFDEIYLPKKFLDIQLLNGFEVYKCGGYY